MTRIRYAVLSAAAVVALVAGSACASTTTSRAAGVSSHFESTSAGARLSTPVTKVLVIVEENHSLAQMKAGMPYLYSLARNYGYATDYRAITHPSEPNYLAIATGSTHGVTTDAAPATNGFRSASVFGQALGHRRTATTYAESMPAPCTLTPSGSYAVKHNPWAYVTNQRTACRAHDLPMAGHFPTDVRRGALPNVGLLVPNLCHDAHNCGLGTADAWLKKWLPTVFNGPDWKAGRLAVVVTADEDDDTSVNRVLTVVMNPQMTRHQVVSAPLSHYSLSRSMSRIAGGMPLGQAANAADLLRAFGL